MNHLKIILLILIFIILDHEYVYGQNVERKLINHLLENVDRLKNTDLPKTLDLLDSLDEIASRTRDNKELLFKVFFLKGNVNKIHYNHTEAQKWYEKAEKVLQENYNREDYLALIVNQANNLYALDQYSRAEKLCDEAIKKCTDNSKLEMQLKSLAYFTKGNLLLVKKDTSGAQYFRKSEEIALKIGFKEHIGALNYKLAKLYKNNRNFEQSIIHCKKAIENYEKNEPDAGIVYDVWAQNLQALDQYDEAALMYEKMIATPNMAPRNKVYGLNSYGILLKDLENYDKSEQILLEALQLVKTLDLKQKEAEILANLGAVQYGREDYEGAYQYYIKAKDIFFDKSLEIDLTNKMYLIEMIIQTGIKGKREGPLFDQYIMLRDTIDQENLKNVNSQYINKYESEKKGKEILELKNKKFLLDIANLNLEKTNALLEGEKLTATLENAIQKQMNDSLQFTMKKEEFIKKDLLSQSEINIQKISQQSRFLALACLALGSVLGLSLLLYYQKKKTKNLNKTLHTQKDKIQLLHQELNHRVKNNLSFMTSLVEMQGRRTQNIEAREILQETESRLGALSLVHSNLFKNDEATTVNLAFYLEELVSQLEKIFAIPGKELNVICDLTDHHVNAEDAMRLGLIVNELVTNSIKHAFTDVNDPQINIATKLDKAGKLILEYKDNGPGHSQVSNLSDDETKAHLGTKLIALLREQMKDRYILVC